MRAALITELSSPPSIGERPTPIPADGSTLLTVAVAALNPIDVAIGAGRFHAGHPPLPYVPAIEAVGRTADGRFVYAQGAGLGISADGFAAEQVAVPESALIEIPGDADPAIAAALGTAGLAGWLSVTARANVTADDIVVVLGASGTVGNIAVQASRLRGARRIVAVGRSAERLAQVERAADATVLIGDDLAARVLEAAGGAPTVVIDMLWGAPLTSILSVVAPRARIVQVGASAGPEAIVPSAAVRGKQLDILGYSNFGVPRPLLVEAYLELLRLTAIGTIAVPIEVHLLDDVVAAWQATAAGTSKVVLRVGEGAA